jgi:hypothetical protein
LSRSQGLLQVFQQLVPGRLHICQALRLLSQLLFYVLLVGLQLLQLRLFGVQLLRQLLSILHQPSVLMLALFLLPCTVRRACVGRGKRSNSMMGWH